MSSCSYHIVEKESENGFFLKIKTVDFFPSLAAFAQFCRKKSEKEGAAAAFLSKIAEKETVKEDEITLFIHSENTLETVEKLSATGLLHFREKKLSCDFYGRYEFFWQIFPNEFNELYVQGAIRNSSSQTEIDFASCHLLTRSREGLWFIKGVSLHIASFSFPFAQSKIAQEPLPLEDSFLEKLLETHNNEEEGKQKVVFLKHSYEIALKDKEPLPILQLTDKKGAFAQLIMDYGKGRVAACNEVSSLTTKGEGGIPPCRRNSLLEKNWEKDLLETDYLFRPLGTSQYYCPTDKVTKSLTFLLELGWTIFDYQKRKIVRDIGIEELRWDKEDELFVLKGKIRYGEHNAAVQDVLGAFNRRETFVSLNSETVALLPTDFRGTPLEGLESALEFISGEPALPAKKAHLIPASGSAVKNSDSALRELLLQYRGETPFPPALPGPAFSGQLRDYQQTGVDWLAFLEKQHLHGLLADDMGLGKTVQILALISRFELQAPVLIVTPTSLLYNWQKEIAKFLPSLLPSTIVFHGPKRKAFAPLFDTAKIILVSYTTLRMESALFQKQLFHSIILDEAQAVKNASTQTFQAIASLNGALRISITGTPLENNLQELWSHFHFLMPELLGEKNHFAADISAAGSDERYLKKIKETIRPFVLRRTKEQVAKELPKLIEQIVWVELNEGQKGLYESFLASARKKLLTKIAADGISKHKMEIFEQLLRLRQICCDPLLVASQLALEEPPSSSKKELLLSDIDTIIAEGSKALVYSQFTSMLGLIAKELDSRGIPYVYLDGSTKDRMAPVDRFQNDKSIPLFLISLKAGGIGLNITAADTVFLLDPWWNNAVEQQAIARAHRIGRKGNVLAKKFIAVETIEEKMVKLKSNKAELSKKIFDEEGEASGGFLAEASLSEEELAFLLS